MIILASDWLIHFQTFLPELLHAKNVPLGPLKGSEEMLKSKFAPLSCDWMIHLRLLLQNYCTRIARKVSPWDCYYFSEVLVTFWCELKSKMTTLPQTAVIFSICSLRYNYYILSSQICQKSSSRVPCQVLLLFFFTNSKSDMTTLLSH